LTVDVDVGSPESVIRLQKNFWIDRTAEEVDSVCEPRLVGV
jgi:hypothetical protein